MRALLPLPLAIVCLASAGAVGGQAPEARLAAARTDELRITHAAFDPPAGAPNVLVHLPPGFRADRPFGVVLFLHGWNGCVRVLVERGESACREGDPPEPGWGLGEAHDAAGTNTVLVVPQLAYLARDGGPGRLGRPGYAQQLLAEALALGVGREAGGARAERVVVVAHSAGYESALAVLRQGRLAPGVTDVVLMDALYAGTRVFADWMIGAPGRRLWSVYTGRSGRPAQESQRLARFVGRRHPEVPRRSLRPPWGAPDGAGARLVVAGSDAPHREVPAQHLADSLRGLELPLRSR